MSQKTRFPIHPVIYNMYRYVPFLLKCVGFYEYHIYFKNVYYQMHIGNRYLLLRIEYAE